MLVGSLEIQKKRTKKMNPKIKNSLNILKQDKLTPNERVFMRSQIERTMAKHAPKHPVASPFYTFFEITARMSASVYSFSRKRAVPFALVIAILFLTAGTSFAAEGSLPGDVLYPVKINVNEQVVGLVSLTPLSKASWAVTTAERRLDEATQLSIEGRLDDSTREQLQQAFNEKAAQVKASVTALSSDNQATEAEDLATSFSSSLKTHEIVLSKISSKKGPQQIKHIAALIGNLKTEIASTTEVKDVIRAQIVASSTSDDATGKTSISAKIASLENKISQLDASYNASVGLLGTTTISTVSTNRKNSLDIISHVSTVLAATSSLDFKTRTELIGDLGQGLQMISDARSLIDLETNSSSDVKNAINISPDSSATSTTTLNFSSLAGTSTDSTGSSSGSGSTTATSTLDINTEVSSSTAATSTIDVASSTVTVAN
ncbi:MAG: DUF5667 domain-containing protein [Candidatus Pacebacteria bacterium]|nr:DUF5667 domain-containing protein [Candidatus Paceibacterota bacterium]